jgi:hypothetical protein
MSPVAAALGREPDDDDDDSVEARKKVESMLETVFADAEDDHDPEDEGTWTCPRCAYKTSNEAARCGDCDKMRPTPANFIGWGNTLVPPEDRARCDNCRIKESPTAECTVCGPIGQSCTLVPTTGAGIASRGHEEPTIAAPAKPLALGSITSAGFIFPTTQQAVLETPPTSDEEYLSPRPAKKRRLN